MTTILHNNQNSKESFLVDYVTRQISAFFPDDFNIKPVIAESMSRALQRTEECIGAVTVWQDRGFDYLVSHQYATFLYYLSNCIWKTTGHAEVATRIFLLNKALNGMDLFYEIEMPPYFFISHSIGSVFAKATYGEYFVFHQGCTVGRSETGRPVLERGVVMYPGSMIIGKCLVRENTVLAPGTILVNQDTPGDCFYLPGQGRELVIQKIGKYYACDYFSDISF